MNVSFLKNKYFILVLVVALLGLVVFWVKSDKSGDYPEVAKLQYSNPVYGISFSYPADFRLQSARIEIGKEKGFTHLAYLYSPLDQDQKDGFGNAPISFHVARKPANYVSLDEFAKNPPPEFVWRHWVVKKSEPFVSDSGEKGLIGMAGTGDCCRMTFFETGEYIFLFFDQRHGYAPQKDIPSSWTVERR